MAYSFKELENISRNKKLFRINSIFNHIDYNHAESEEHNKEMFRQFFELRKANFYLAVRQKLLNGKMPDIAILSTPELISKEVMVSESKKRFMEKEYPGRKMEVKKCQTTKRRKN